MPSTECLRSRAMIITRIEFYRSRNQIRERKWVSLQKKVLPRIRWKRMLRWLVLQRTEDPENPFTTLTIWTLLIRQARRGKRRSRLLLYTHRITPKCEQVPQPRPRVTTPRNSSKTKIKPRISTRSQALKVLKIEMMGQELQARRGKAPEAVVLLVTSEELNRGHPSKAKGGHRKKQKQVKARLKHLPRLLRAHPPETIQELDLEQLLASRRS